jgi:beta-1,4-mannosyl-glycoprotein beta-1,4-N-acetylglucosaminyltransferase
MIYDAFCFFNELDLLEFRLKLLYDHIDKFVICESNLTFSGHNKSYNYYDNISRFEKWNDKIIYLPIEQDKSNFFFRDVDTYTPDNGPFKVEYEQRNALFYIREHLKDDDMILMGDLDEIPDPKIIDQLNSTSDYKKTGAISLSMLFHYYYTNCQVIGHDRYWNGTVVCNGRYFKDHAPQYVRDKRNMYPRVPNGGWHFSYLGGIEKIKTKIRSFAHTEFNRPDILSDDNISQAIAEGKDILKRPGVSYSYVSLEEYPSHLKEVMLQYPQFIKDDTK